jgi:hypothetical protein
MKPLQRLIADHPLKKTPYNAIKFVRVDGEGTPLYKVGRGQKTMGAASALRLAAQTFGGHCFYCNKYMRAEDVPEVCTNDHVQPRSKVRHDYLHNLVFACVDCNKEKGARDLISYRPEDCQVYLEALDAHLVECLRSLGSK